LLGSELLARSDLTLVSGGSDEQPAIRVAVHRAVCRVRIEYFRHLFDAGLADATASELTLDCSAEALRVVVLWMYSGAARISSEAVVEVLMAAHMLQCDALTHYVESVVIRNLDKDSVPRNVTSGCCRSTLNVFRL
jgi:hypothetical protein